MSITFQQKKTLSFLIFDFVKLHFDNSEYKKYYDDVVNRLHNFIIAHVKLVVSSDGDDCQQKMDKVVLKTIRKTCYLVLTNAKQFNTANTAYHADEDKHHDDINDSNYLIVYLDIHRLYPIRMECIDTLDWTKIYLTIQPEPASPTTASVSATNSGRTSNDIDHLVAAIYGSTIQGCS